MHVTEIEAQRLALAAPQQTQGATPQNPGASTEAQRAIQVQAPGTQSASDKERRTDHLPVLRLVDTETQGGNKEAIFAYIETQLAEGYTPSVPEVMGAIGCKERTAQKYRKQALDELTAAAQSAK